MRKESHNMMVQTLLDCQDDLHNLDFILKSVPNLPKGKLRDQLEANVVKVVNSDISETSRKSELADIQDTSNDLRHQLHEAEKLIAEYQSIVTDQTLFEARKVEIPTFFQRVWRHRVKVIFGLIALYFLVVWILA